MSDPRITPQAQELFDVKAVRGPNVSIVDLYDKRTHDHVACFFGATDDLAYERAMMFARGFAGNESLAAGEEPPKRRRKKADTIPTLEV